MPWNADACVRYLRLLSKGFDVSLSRNLDHFTSPLNCGPEGREPGSDNPPRGSKPKQ